MNIRFGLLFILTLLSQACKKDTPEPVYPLNLIAGDWNMTAQWNKDTNDWTTLPATEQEIVRFRNDGLQVNKNDKAFCCLTFEYVINGVEVKLDIKGGIPYISGCEVIDCYACETLNMVVKDDTLIIEYCNGDQLKLQRV